MTNENEFVNTFQELNKMSVRELKEINITKLFGASDDLIEFNGFITDESYSNSSGSGDYVSFDNGLMFHILYAKEGVWRINPVNNPTNTHYLKHTCIYDDNETDGYSDIVFIKDVKYSVVGKMVGKN